jgi:mRNA interferase MazF
VVIRRGEIWWAGLGRPFGSSPGYRRPVLVLQTNDFNESPINTVIVAAITSNLDLSAAPGNVLCRRRDTGLAKDSVINVSQVVTLDKRALFTRVGTLAVRKLVLVEEGMRLVLGL